MKSNILKILVLAFAAILLNSCQSKPQPSEADPVSTAPKSSSWKVKMHEMAGNLRAILPYVYSTEEFQDPAHRSEIQENLYRFTSAVKELKAHSKNNYPEKDPGLSVALERLQNDVNAAKESFQKQDFPYAQANLKNVTQYCFFCHTRRTNGLKLNMGSELSVLKNATGLEKSDYFVATRQFDKARQVLKQMLTDTNQEFSFQKEKGLRKLLLIELRANDNPENALLVLNQYGLNKTTPAYLKNLIQAWKTDLENWKESQRKVPKKLRELERLITKADAKKSFSYDEISNITYIMASRGLHDLLESPQSSRNRAKTYFLLGKTYETLRGVGPWNLNEIYYESCIRKLKHSQLAMKCYRELESSMIIGYTGSGGYFVPFQVRKHLSYLKKMAQPRKKLE